MRCLMKWTLRAALVVFGGVVAGVQPSVAAEAASCDGRESPLCGTRTVEDCFDWKICGFSPFFPRITLIMCCEAYSTTTQYFYYEPESAPAK